MDTPQSTTSVEKQLQQALAAAESPEVRYHIRESLQKLYLAG